MYDVNLMLLDEADVTGTGSEITGAWLDLWAENADVAPQLSQYEVSTGDGGMVRSLAWQLIIPSATATGADADVVVEVQYSDDGSAENGEVSTFPTLADINGAGFELVDRLSFKTKSRYAKYSVQNLALNHVLSGASLGIVETGEYTDAAGV